MKSPEFWNKGNRFIWALVLGVFSYFSLPWTVTGIWETDIWISCAPLMLLTTHFKQFQKMTTWTFVLMGCLSTLKELFGFRQKKGDSYYC